MLSFVCFYLKNVKLQRDSLGGPKMKCISPVYLFQLDQSFPLTINNVFFNIFSLSRKVCNMVVTCNVIVLNYIFPMDTNLRCSWKSVRHLRQSVWRKFLATKNNLNYFRKTLHLKCLKRFWIRNC